MLAKQLDTAAAEGLQRFLDVNKEGFVDKSLWVNVMASTNTDEIFSRQQVRKVFKPFYLHPPMRGPGMSSTRTKKVRNTIGTWLDKAPSYQRSRSSCRYRSMTSLMT